MIRHPRNTLPAHVAAAKPGMDLEWCKHADAGLPLPDLILFMDLSVEKAAERGGFGEER